MLMIRSNAIKSYGTWELDKSLNQQLSLSYLQNFFDIKDMDLSDEVKRTLGLIDEDGDFTNLKDWSRIPAHEMKTSVVRRGLL